MTTADAIQDAADELVGIMPHWALRTTDEHGTAWRWTTPTRSWRLSIGLQSGASGLRGKRLGLHLTGHDSSEPVDVVLPITATVAMAELMVALGAIEKIDERTYATLTKIPPR